MSSLPSIQQLFNSFLILFSLAVCFAACESKTQVSSVPCSENLAQFESLIDKADAFYDEEEVLMTQIKNCSDSSLAQALWEFDRYFAFNVFWYLLERQKDLMLANGEAKIRFVADTLQVKNLTSFCDTTVANKFIANGFEKLIFADLNYYEHSIQSFKIYKRFGSGIDSGLIKHWKSKYRSNMSQGEVHTLLQELRIHILENNLQLKKNVLKHCEKLD